MKIKNEQFFLTLKKFLQIYLIKNRSCSKNTVKSYTDSLNLYFSYMENEHNVPLCKMDWGCFTYENVSNFLIWLEEERGNGKQTQIQRLTAIRAFVRYAGILDVTAVSVQAEIEKIKLRKPPKSLVPYLSKEQLAVFLKQPDVSKSTGLRNMVFLTVMYDTAARCQEMVDLTIDNLVLNTKSPCIYLTGKGNKTRVIPLMPKTVLHLKHYLEKFHPSSSRKQDDHLFFTISHGERHRMSEDNVAAFVKRYGEMARRVLPELPDCVCPHMLRHSRAMHWYQDGMPLTLLSDLLGHAQLETTKIYAYADITMKREAIQKANIGTNYSVSGAIWKNDEEILRKLTGLK